MNSVQSRSFPTNLRDEETALVENAVRLAIDSILNALSGVHSARTREHQRTVEDRDKEIRRLERRLRGIEHELQVLRRQGCTCSLFGNELGPGGSHTSSGDRQRGERSGFEPGCLDPEVTAGQQECEMSISDSHLGMSHFDILVTGLSGSSCRPSRQKNCVPVKIFKKPLNSFNELGVEIFQTSGEKEPVVFVEPSASKRKMKKSGPAQTEPVVLVGAASSEETWSHFGLFIHQEKTKPISDQTDATPAPPVKTSVTEEEIETLSEAITDNYLNRGSLVDTTRTLAEQTSSSLLHVFVRLAVDT